MSGFLTRVAERALGRADALRPAVNRYLITVRDDDAGGTLAAANAPAVTPGGRPDNVASSLRSGPNEAYARHGAPERIDANANAVSTRNAPLHTAVAGAATATPLRPMPRLPEAGPDERATDARLDPLRAQPEPVSVPAPMRAEPRLLPLEPSAASGAPAGIERVPAATAAEPPAVHVHIGRIDIRAIDAPPAIPLPERTGPRGPSLAEHLRARERNVR